MSLKPVQATTVVLAHRLSRVAGLSTLCVAVAFLLLMASQQLPPSGHAAPRSGDRFLQFQQPWLDHVLDGSKTLQIRGSSTTPGGAFLPI